MPDSARSSSPSSSDVALAFDRLSVGYGERTILQNIDMQVRRGQVVAIMGGSGSGKTTLLRAATGQLAPQAGRVVTLGEDLSRLSGDRLFALRKRMGVLFQQGALFTDLDVFENVAFPLREHTSMSEAEILDRVLAKLDAVGLKAAAFLRTSEISGGMARRLALARAVVLEPELILYDEPFAGLDPISMGVTAQLIRTMTDTLGCASVLITHDVQESFHITDQVYLLGRGSLVASGTPAELSASKDPFVHQFLNGEPDGPVAFQYPETPEYRAWLERRRSAR
ncbi:MAG: ABC transporter ATP-binding protein [Pigmentiphaga sp.]|uniref:ABC transporter ATP-binding protein n=1 Tax=Pigmentiphaga sp. TaxID=1977564 RepID=UPI0029A3CCF6|nr:ABC transporter ATP-binding protein [Pigmentiphaga sp.]MDX3907983.1 ABC transporter ATP-binding protein [Pigmentiphaga sp.]